MKAQWFGRYLLLDKVAAGGMAEVWRAKLVGEANFQRIVALKKILPHVSEDPEFISMFQDEANITVLLQHPNIGQVFEFAKEEDLYYIAMEYISGKDLKTIWAHLRQRKQVIPQALSCYIVQKMAEGLDYAHRKRDNFGNPLGIVHRDVSPQNVLLSWEGDVKVIDFGIAAAEDKASKTRAGTLKGKFAYMSPDQIRGFKLDGRADTFALGVVLYELLTGERGFAAESEFSLLEKVRNVDIKPPTMVNHEIPPELERIVFKALTKDRDERYAYASDFAEDLQRYLLMHGRPPNAQSLGQFLRETFTVEYDKERLRLESYREVEAEPPKKAEPPPPPQALPPPPPNPGLSAVQAAMAMDRGPVGDSGAFAAAPGVGAFADSGAMPVAPVHQGTSTSYVMAAPPAEHTAATTVAVQRTNPGIAPPMQRTFVGPAPTPAAPATSKLKVAGITAALVGSLAVAAAVGSQFIGATGTVIVTVNGVDSATVRIDGQAVGVAAPSVTQDGVDEGQHTVIIEKPGYKTHTAPLIVEAGRVVSLNTTLKRMGGRLSISSEPSGAQVLLDGHDTGKKTPVVLDDVESGTFHEVTLKLAGFRDTTEREVRTEVGQEKRLRISLKPDRIKVTITSDPPDATVFVDGAEVGKAPVSFERDPDQSPPRIELKRSKCKSYSTTLPLGVDEPEVSRTLRMECR